jgi:hypothetical protein
VSGSCGGPPANYTPWPCTKVGQIDDPYLESIPNQPQMTSSPYTGCDSITGGAGTQTGRTYRPDQDYSSDNGPKFGHFCRDVRLQTLADTIQLDCSGVAAKDCVFWFHRGTQITGGSLTSNTGVLLVNTCRGTSSNPAYCTGNNQPDPFSVSGGATINLTGNSFYERILVWNDRNTQYTTPTPGLCSCIAITGGGSQQWNGNLYAPTAKVGFSGASVTAGGTSLIQNINIVAWNIDIGGTVNITFPWANINAPVRREIALIE